MLFELQPEVCLALNVFAEQSFAVALQSAPPGLFDLRSRHYWHNRLRLLLVPPLPQRVFRRLEKQCAPLQLHQASHPARSRHFDRAEDFPPLLCRFHALSPGASNVTLLWMTRADAKQIAKAWRKSRIAARILLREERGKLTPRDVRVGRMLGDDRAVTPRLIQQAINGFKIRENRLTDAGRQAA